MGSITEVADLDEDAVHNLDVRWPLPAVRRAGQPPNL
jgi:hypothetical protein